jgi:hypothetical protein
MGIEPMHGSFADYRVTTSPLHRTIFFVKYSLILAESSTFIKVHKSPAHAGEALL